MVDEEHLSKESLSKLEKTVLVVGDHIVCLDEVISIVCQSKSYQSIEKLRVHLCWLVDLSILVLN